MQPISEFIAGYTEPDRQCIAFVWNGKHSAEFVDDNQAFRWQVVQACLGAPEAAPPLLLEHLFLEDARWSCEAWGAPRHFGQLGGLLLARGGEDALTSFAMGHMASFDAYGASHQIRLAPELLSRLARAAQARIAVTDDQRQRTGLESALELFGKLQAGNADKGWVTLGPGAEAADIAVVWPRWYHKAWHKLAALVRRLPAS
jgi:hypothetical protein